MSRFKVAIVGAGPAGYFAAQALQNLQSEELQFSIDMIERLPTPWGLVRSGVAPDHPKIKTVSKVFEKIAFFSLCLISFENKCKRKKNEKLINFEAPQGFQN
mgnify:CR=1 FL=1